MPFEFFDPSQEVAVSQRQLPHWFQPGIAYFVTFRTADSLPNEVVRQWLEERGRWLRAEGIDPQNPTWHQALRQLSEQRRTAFHRQFSREFHRYLDAGHGECLLGRPDLSDIVAQSLLHFDGQRYHLGDFVVMPNHVHLLVGLLGDTDLQAQCYSWKKFTAGQINAKFGRKGHFWQGECFDHAVRDPEQYVKFQHYIADNPKRARLPPGQYRLWQRP